MKPFLYRIFIVFVLIFTGICLYFLINKTDYIKRTVFTPNVLDEPNEKISEKGLLIKKLQSVHEIVGLKGEYEDTIDYNDVKSLISVKWLDRFSKREYLVKTMGNYQFGVDLDQIKPADIKFNSTSGNVKITLPRTTLVSFEMPYDSTHYQINKKTDLLALGFTTADDQSIYKYVYSKVKKEVQEDKKIHSKAILGTEDAVKKIISSVPGIKSVEFITNE